MKNNFQKSVLERLAAIEENLSEHMRRTEILEDSVKPLMRIYHFIQVSGFIVMSGGAVAALIKLFF